MSGAMENLQDGLNAQIEALSKEELIQELLARGIDVHSFLRNTQALESLYRCPKCSGSKLASASQCMTCLEGSICPPHDLIPSPTSGAHDHCRKCGWNFLKDPSAPNTEKRNGDE